MKKDIIILVSSPSGMGGKSLLTNFFIENNEDEFYMMYDFKYPRGKKINELIKKKKIIIHLQELSVKELSKIPKEIKKRANIFHINPIY